MVSGYCRLSAYINMTLLPLMECNTVLPLLTLHASFQVDVECSH